MRARSFLSLLTLTLSVTSLAGAQEKPSASERRAELEQVLRQRYRATTIGPGVLGLRGKADTIRQAGGVVEVRRNGLYGSLERNSNATIDVRGERSELVRGRKDQALVVGEQFYVHSVYVGEDVVTLGLVSTRLIPTARGTGRLWAAINFFLPADRIANLDSNAIVSALDQWLLPEGQRPATAAASPAAPAAVSATAAPPVPAAAPSVTAELKAGMAREEVLALLGPPQREVSYGARTWMTYAGMVVVIENGRLAAVDRSGQPPAKVIVRSEPDGADVYLGETFVGSTPATLELPAGSYKVSVRLPGYKDWQREVQVLGGSELTLRARLDK